MKNLAAFTPVEHPYPAYISVNMDDDDPEIVSITVRSSAASNGECGSVSCIKMRLADFHTLCHDMFMNMPLVPGLATTSEVTK